MKYRNLLLSKHSRTYALQVFSNSVKHQRFIENPQGIAELPASTRSNVLKAMVNLAKFLGIHEEYKLKLRNHGIKWLSTDDSFNSFLRIVNNQHSNLGEYYKSALNILRGNEKLYLKFVLLTGIRKEEAINSFNLIIKLNSEGKLGDYYNEELGILEHFKHGELFLRKTKKVYISIVAKGLISEIANSQEVSYFAIRKRLTNNKLTLRIKELRSYYATYLRNNGILSEYIDLLQGRIPKSVFARHYLKVDDFKTLVAKVNAVTENLEKELLS
jgi:hypothetical protein